MNKDKAEPTTEVLPGWIEVLGIIAIAALVLLCGGLKAMAPRG